MGDNDPKSYTSFLHGGAESTLTQRNRVLSRSVSREVRMARNSRGVHEEFNAPRENDVVFVDVSAGSDDGSKAGQGRSLMTYFCLMVFIGLGNKVFSKLETIPMRNYPNFLNLLTTFVFIPCCFAYIIPAARKGWIPREQLEMPRKPFAVMGGLDAMAGIMQVFSATYLPGPLLILLGQAAIPVSMILSKYMLKAEYNKFQYVGALIVAAGIVVVLAPSLSGGGNITWSIIMVCSTVPMALSSIYKEIALGETELDPMYLNGWIAVFQLLFSLPLMLPAALVSDPPVSIPDLPSNLFDGLKCFVGIDTITCDPNDGDCEADNCYPQAPTFVCLYLFFNQLYNLLIILILKYGSANILYLALTLMVPLGNVAFTLDFIPEHAPLKATDIIGLVVISFGLFCYRFAKDMWERYRDGRERESSSGMSDGSKRPLLDLLIDAESIIESTSEADSLSASSVGSSSVESVTAISNIARPAVTNSEATTTTTGSGRRKKSGSKKSDGEGL